MLQTILHMNLGASLLILVTLLVRRFFLDRIPKELLVGMWLLSALRLVIPWGLPLPFLTRGTAAAGTALLRSAQLQADALPQSGFPLSAALSLLWVAGALTAGLLFGCRHWQFRCLAWESLPVQQPHLLRWQAEHPLSRTYSLRRSDRIAAPVTYGLIHPVILLPAGLEVYQEEEQSLLLLHEYCHICRWDVLKKQLFVLTALLFWFNPLVWVMLHYASRDIELACDQAVLRQSQSSQRSYAALLLSFAAGPGDAPDALTCSAGAHPLEERIISIMKLKKSTALTLILAVILSVTTVAAFATAPTATSTQVVESQSAQQKAARLEDAADPTEQPAAAEIPTAAEYSGAEEYAEEEAAFADDPNAVEMQEVPAAATDEEIAAQIPEEEIPFDPNDREEVPAAAMDEETATQIPDEKIPFGLNDGEEAPSAATDAE